MNIETIETIGLFAVGVPLALVILHHFNKGEDPGQYPPPTITRNEKDPTYLLGQLGDDMPIPLLVFLTAKINNIDLSIVDRVDTYTFGRIYDKLRLMGKEQRYMNFYKERGMPDPYHAQNFKHYYDEVVSIIREHPEPLDEKTNHDHEELELSEDNNRELTPEQQKVFDKVVAHIKMCTEARKALGL
jgi:hypothetical protein